MTPIEAERAELMADIRLAIAARPISPALAFALQAPAEERSELMAAAREHGRRWTRAVLLAHRERLAEFGLTPEAVEASMDPFPEEEE